jgi:hypothetical protein
MPNYDIPPPTPREKLTRAFSDIQAGGLPPLDTISRSLDAIADAIRAHAHEPDTLFDLAEAVSVSAADLAAVVTIVPDAAPKVAKPKATPAPEA